MSTLPKTNMTNDKDSELFIVSSEFTLWEITNLTESTCTVVIRSTPVLTIYCSTVLSWFILRSRTHKHCSFCRQSFSVLYQALFSRNFFLNARQMTWSQAWPGRIVFALLALHGRSPFCPPLHFFSCTSRNKVCRPSQSFLRFLFQKHCTIVFL